MRFGSLAGATIGADRLRCAGNTHPMQVFGTEGAGSAAEWGVSGTEFPVLVPQVLIERTGTGALIDLLRIKLGFPPEVFALAACPVIEGYAGFVQLLPVPESRHHVHPGGRLSHGLEIALRALDHRRGQILPRSAPPEVIGAQAHRWTYAVFVAALLYDTENTPSGLRILMRVRGGDSKPWDPLAGSMLAQGASSYRMEIVEGDAIRDDRHRALPGRLFGQCVPEPVRVWLAGDATLMPELSGWFSGDGAGARGAIAELVLRAAMSPGAGDRSRQMVPSRQVSGAAPSAQAGHSEDSVAEDVETKFLEDVIEKVPARKPPLARALADGATEVARRFIGWLQSGISDGTIRVNERGALVHGVPEGMLLVSPRIFREFVRPLARCGHEGRVGLPNEGTEAAKWVQRRVLRAGWHVEAEGGINILVYQVMHGERAVARLSGVVIRNPEQLIGHSPTLNPALVRSPETRERA